MHLDLRITRGDVAADRDELSREVGRLLLLALEMQIHLLAVAGEELCQAESGLVAQTLIKDWAILFDALLVTLQITLMALAVAVAGGVGLAVLFSLVNLNHWMLVNHIRPMLEALAVRTDLAILAAAALGPAQVAGRLLMYFFEHHLDVHRANRLILTLLPLALDDASADDDFDDDQQDTGPLWRRRLITWSMAAVALGLGFLIPYTLYLNQQVTQRFGELRWQIPTRVYARPLVLLPGKAMDAATLKTELAASAYRDDGQGKDPATYAVQGGRFVKSYLGANWWATTRLKFGGGWGRTWLDDAGTQLSPGAASVRCAPRRSAAYDLRACASVASMPVDPR